MDGWVDGFDFYYFLLFYKSGNSALMIWERPLVESQDILKSNNNGDENNDENNNENKQVNKTSVPYKFLIMDSKEKKIAMVSVILAFVAFSSYVLLQVPRR